MFAFDGKKVNFDQELGFGRYGMVYPYQKNPEDQRWVVKIMSTKKIKEFIAIIQEIVLGFSFDHPNVLPVKGFHIDKSNNEDEPWFTYLKLPRMVCSLKDRIAQRRLTNNYFPEEQVVKYFYDLACGLQYLHSRGIAHRDIKPGNILFDKNDQVKIGDLGIGQLIQSEVNKTLSNFSGTRQYSAPEILFKHQNLKKKDLFEADIWSLGVVVAELCLLELGIIEAQELFEKTEAEVFHNLKKVGGKRYNKVLIDLILSLLKYNPSQRPSLQQIKTILEENYPSILKELNKDVQADFGSNLAQMQREILKTEELRLNKQEIDILLKKFQENWKKDFTLEIEFQKDIIIGAKNLGITDNQLESFMEEFTQVSKITNNREIKQFEMNLSCCNQITDNAVKILAQQIGSNLKSVQHLKLLFGNERCYQISDEGINELSTQIGANIKTLQKLELRFYGCSKITNNGLKTLAQAIGSNLKQLQELKLDFDACKEITDDEFNTLSQEIESNLKQLRVLYLNCEWKIKSRIKPKTT